MPWPGSCQTALRLMFQAQTRPTASGPRRFRRQRRRGRPGGPPRSSTARRSGCARGGRTPRRRGEAHPHGAGGRRPSVQRGRCPEGPYVRRCPRPPLPGNLDTVRESRRPSRKRDLDRPDDCAPRGVLAGQRADRRPTKDGGRITLRTEHSLRRQPHALVQVPWLLSHTALHRFNRGMLRVNSQAMNAGIPISFSFPMQNRCMSAAVLISGDACPVSSERRERSRTKPGLPAAPWRNRS